MRRSRPSSGLFNRVCPGMISFHRLFQAERPSSRVLVYCERSNSPPVQYTTRVPKTFAEDTGRKAWCLRMANNGSLSESLDCQKGVVEKPDPPMLKGNGIA